MSTTNAPTLGMPKVEQILTVTLPQERTRAQVTEVHEDGTISATLVLTPMAKSHAYRLGETLKFHRVRGVTGDSWECD